MDFALNEEMEMIRDSAREYAERVLKPNAAALDAAEEFVSELKDSLNG